MLILQLKNNLTHPFKKQWPKYKSSFDLLVSCFYHHLLVKWVCIHIGYSSRHTAQTHSRFTKYQWMFDTECNAHQIDILDDLFD